MCHIFTGLFIITGFRVLHFRHQYGISCTLQRILHFMKIFTLWFGTSCCHQTNFRVHFSHVGPIPAIHDSGYFSQRTKDSREKKNFLIFFLKRTHNQLFIMQSLSTWQIESHEFRFLMQQTAWTEWFQTHSSARPWRLADFFLDFM